MLLLLSTAVDVINDSSQKHKIIFLCFWILVFTLFRGLRWQTGTDWFQFYYCFENATWDNIFTYNRYEERGGSELMEFGYMFLNRFIKIFGNYTVFLTITNLFLLISYACFVLKCVPKYPLMTFAMMMVCTLFFPVRLQLASGVMIWAMYFTCKNKWLWYVITVILSYTIHKSALLFLPFYFILKIRIPLYVIFFLFFIFEIVLTPDMLISIFVSLGELLFGIEASLGESILKYSNIGQIETGGNQFLLGNIASILFSAFLLFFFCYARSLVKEVNKLKIYNIFFNAFFIFTIMMKAFQGDALSHYARFATFLAIGVPVTFTIFIEIIKEKIPIICLYVFFVFLYIYKFIALTTAYPEEHFPYRSIFS
jgi:hypothetical protein